MYKNGRFSYRNKEIKYTRYTIYISSHVVFSDDEEIYAVDTIYDRLLNDPEIIAGIIERVPKTKSGDIDYRYRAGRWYDVLERLDENRIISAYIGEPKNFIIIGIVNNSKKASTNKKRV